MCFFSTTAFLDPTIHHPLTTNHNRGQIEAVGETRQRMRPDYFFYDLYSIQQITYTQ